MGHCQKRVLSFFVTTRCNLTCHYCFVRGRRSNEVIDRRFAELGIRRFAGEEGYTDIRFSGAGEPTCAFDAMMNIYSSALGVIGPAMTSELQTNGYFSDEVCAWVGDTQDIIWVSCDGPPHICDERTDSLGGDSVASTVARNIRQLTSHGKGMTGVRATITAENIFRQPEILEYFAELGVRHVWSDPIFPGVGSSLHSVPLINLMDYAHEFLAAQESAERLGITYGSILTCNFDEQVRYHCRCCLPTPHLTTDGYVSACDMAPFGTDIPSRMNVFVFGRWDKVANRIVLDQTKISALRGRDVESLAACAACPAKNHCAGYCPGEVVNETGSLAGRKEVVCPAIQYLWQNMRTRDIRYPFLHP